MNLENITFDNFYSLDSKTRKAILNDPESLKVLLRKNISEKRYLHSLSVADVCKMLAKYHHVDEDLAYMTGLLHDVCKFPNSDTSGILEEYLKYYDPEKLKTNAYPVYHSWVAKYYLKEKCNFHDKRILNAIYNHTICNSRDKLSIILYIADKREPLRNIDDGIIESAKKDLMGTYKKLCLDVERYIKSKNEQFTRNSI